MQIPHIQNAFDNIKTACELKLAKLYSKGVPTPIKERYETELGFLEVSEHIDDFEIFRLLSEESIKCSTVINMRGTVAGSFIYYLLGNNCFNPLPVYYYCPECGYYEPVQTHLFGIDLPEKKCPQCGHSILADGFNLHSESVWGNDGKKIITFDYNVSDEFLPFARRVLTSLYPQNEVVPWGMFQLDPPPHPNYTQGNIVGVNLAGYVILPIGNTIQDYPDLTSCLDNGDACLTGGGWELANSFLKTIRLFSLEHINKLIQLQRATGIYTNEITNKELREITWSNIHNATVLDTITSSFFYELKPKTFTDMIALKSSVHSTFSWQELDQKDLYTYNQMITSDAFKKYPCYTREDFFDYLLEANIERTLAFTVSEQIRKGHANSVKFKDSFNQLSIPEEIKDVARNYLYIFPRAHCIEFILMYARLAYYAKVDSRAFSKIMFNKKVLNI